jgi:hypothetical protein
VLKVKLRGASVADGGAEREVEFYDRFEIVADDGRELYTLRLSSDGALEVSAVLITARHAGTLLDDKFSIRPEGAGCVTIRRDKYRES